MEQESDDDLHLCLSCHVMIGGLENYINHKKNLCPSKGKPGLKSKDILNIPLSTSTISSDQSSTSIGNHSIIIPSTTSTLAVSLSSLETSRSFLSPVRYPLEIFTTDAGQPLQSSAFVSPIKTASAQVSTVSGTALSTNAISKICNDTQGGLKEKPLEKLETSEDQCDKVTGNENMPDAATVADFFSSLELKVREPTDKHPCDLQTSPLKTVSLSANKEDAFEERLKNIKIANILTDLNFSSDSEGLPSDVDELLNFSDADIDESERISHGGKWKPSSNLSAGHSRGGKWRPGGKVMDVGKQGKKAGHIGKSRPELIPESSGGKWRPGQRVAHGLGKYGKLRAAYKAYRGLTESEDEEEVSSDKPKKISPESDSGKLHTVWCEVCQKSFRSRYYLDKHKTTSYHKKHMKKPKKMLKKPSLKCGVCDKVFNNKYNLVRHLAAERHLSTDSQEEEHRNQLKSLDDNLQILILRQKPFQCRLCLFYSDNKDVFTDHVCSEDHINKSVGLLGPLCCVRCKFTTTDNQDLIKHVRSEEHKEVVGQSDRPCVVKECRSNIPCQQCDKTLTSWVKLWQHIKSAHSGSRTDKPLRQRGHVNRPQCPYCDTRWPCETALQIHIRRRHSGERPFMCDVCKLSFSSKSDLNRHYISSRHLEVAMQLGTRKDHVPPTTKDKAPSSDKEINSQTMNGQKKSKTKRGAKKRCKYQSCEYETTAGKDLREHYKTTHENSQRFVCEACGYRANHKSHWDKHCTSHKHLQLTRGATDNKERDGQQQQGEDDGRHGCDTCKLAFSSELALHKHKLTHTVISETDLLRESQGDEFKYLEVRYHEFVRSLPAERDAQVQCRECGKETTRKQIVGHLRSHTAIAPFHCLYCDKSFQRGERLKAHLQMHFPKKWHMCEHCPSKYRDLKSLKQHIISHHPQQVDFQIDYMCSICGYKCMSSTSLRVHMTSHLDNDQKRFRCPWKGCKKRFQFKSTLNYHLRRHRKERPFLCDQCGFAAIDRQHLNRHKRKHTGIRNYKCEYCTYSYFNSSGLRRHMRLHINAKPYSCPYPKDCQFRSNCLEHVRKHVNHNSKHVLNEEYLYPCKRCTEGFKSQGELRQHLRSVHTVEATQKETSICGLHPHVIKKSLDLRAVPEGQKVNPVKEQFVAKKWRQASSYSEACYSTEGLEGGHVRERRDSEPLNGLDCKLVVVTDIIQ